MEEKIYCFGCGAPLQDVDESKDGYVDPRAFLNKKNVLCKRCFQLKHYGKFSPSSLVKNTIDRIIEDASKDDLLVLLVDCALKDTPLIPILKKLNDYPNLLLIANRFDLYQSYIRKEKLLSFLQSSCKKSGIHTKEIWIIDGNITEIFQHLCEESIGRNIYLVGLENAGKTTFINQILKKMENEDESLLIHSKYPGTTVDLIKIPLDDKTFLIDSPGIYSKGNFLHFIDKDEIKTLGNDRKICSYTYQLSPHQSILISNVLRIDFHNSCNCQIFMPDSLLLTRCKTENAWQTFHHQIPYLKWKCEKIKKSQDLQKTNLKLAFEKYYDIVIEGLGFFRVKGGAYTVFAPKGVHLFTRSSMI